MFQLIGYNRVSNNNNKSVVLVTHQADVSIKMSQSCQQQQQQQVGSSGHPSGGCFN